jgi:hypothetical protein
MVIWGSHLRNTIRCNAQLPKAPERTSGRAEERGRSREWNPPHILMSKPWRCNYIYHYLYTYIYVYSNYIYMIIWNYIYKDHPKMDAMKNLMKQLKESGTHSNINYGSQICQLSPLWDEQVYGCKREDQRNTTMVACLHALYLGTWSLMEPLELWSYIYIYRERCVYIHIIYLINSDYINFDIYIYINTNICIFKLYIYN